MGSQEGVPWVSMSKLKPSGIMQNGLSFYTAVLVLLSVPEIDRDELDLFIGFYRYDWVFQITMTLRFQLDAFNAVAASLVMPGFGVNRVLFALCVDGLKTIADYQIRERQDGTVGLTQRQDVCVYGSDASYISHDCEPHLSLWTGVHLLLPMVKRFAFMINAFC
jgi:hypothetical protein